jgi:hypothetical protein
MLDARIMQFMSRKEAQFPELKQPSVVMYKRLTHEAPVSDMHLQHDRRARNHASRSAGRNFLPAL